MRTLAALVVSVFLVPGCFAEDWTQLHDKGLEAAGKGDFVAAANLFRQSHAVAKTDTQSAVSANDLGIALHQTGREAEAGKWLQCALDFWKSTPSQRPNIAETSLALAAVNRMMGNYTVAETILGTLMGQPGLSAESRSRLYSSLGDIMREQGRFAEARGLVKQAEDVPGISWKRRLENAMVVAQLDRDTKNWDASIDEWNQAADLAREKRAYGMEAACVHGLGHTWLDRGNTARAEPLLKRALNMYEVGPLKDDTLAASVLTGLGELYLTEDKPSMAEEVLIRSLEFEERGLGPGHPQIAIVLELLASAVAQRNRIEMARAYLDRAEKIMSGHFGENSVMAVGVLASWGAIERRAGQPDRAAVEFRKALDALGPAGPDLDPLRLQVMKQYAEVLKATHHDHEAKEVLVQARNLLPDKRQ